MRRLQHFALPLILTGSLLTGSLLTGGLLIGGCASSGPPAPAAPTIIAQITSEPAGIEISFRGRKVGQTPFQLSLSSFDDAVEVSTVNDLPPVLERRIKVLAPNRLEIQMRTTGEPSPLMKALGLSKVVVFDYGHLTTFAVDSYELKPDLRPLLQRQAAMLESTFAGVDVYVCGHTDATGGDDHNMSLSLNRAQSVADFLVAENVDTARLKVQGFGSEYPIASNADREGRAFNRRTEIILPD